VSAPYNNRNKPARKNLSYYIVLLIVYLLKCFTFRIDITSIGDCQSATIYVLLERRDSQLCEGPSERRRAICGPGSTSIAFNANVLRNTNQHTHYLSTFGNILDGNDHVADASVVNIIRAVDQRRIYRSKCSLKSQVLHD
jgi:hypothetical protein